MKNSEIRWTISKKRLEIVYHETTMIAPHLFRFLCVIWIFFTSPAAKSFHRSPIFWFILASLLAMDSGNSNSSPENILSSGGNMRISEKGIVILLRKISVGSENLCFSSDLHTGLRICLQNCSFVLRCQEEAEWEWFWITLIQTNNQPKNVQAQLDAKD